MNACASRGAGPSGPMLGPHARTFGGRRRRSWNACRRARSTAIRVSPGHTTSPGHWVPNLADARQTLAEWRTTYNRVRLHRA